MKSISDRMTTVGVVVSVWLSFWALLPSVWAQPCTCFLKYPELMREAMVDGEVTLDVGFHEGRAVSFDWIRTDLGSRSDRPNGEGDFPLVDHPEIMEALTHCMRQWRFRDSVEGTITITLAFRLSGGVTDPDDLWKRFTILGTDLRFGVPTRILIEAHVPLVRHP